ncbi:hypothetical protein K443DRAFT_117386 [Laccaria amethystina LaAM-08-1]|uniref:AMP-binding enzyme C-terminal domain-containing protein n=1 Tax=Laccaria amethystina LaAM-08-1 TaxID=1095629 RepID=A0A0C9WZV8_9AGAR|nr:hypothetical protein K443DRAFT_117386 [Laccaria amethystina LaAM-08-1]
MVPSLCTVKYVVGFKLPLHAQYLPVVIGTADELTGQAVYAFVTLNPEFARGPGDESLVLQVRRVIGPFTAPEKVFIMSDLPKTRSRKVHVARRCIEDHARGEQLGDLSTVVEPAMMDVCHN